MAKIIIFAMKEIMNTSSAMAATIGKTARPIRPRTMMTKRGSANDNRMRGFRLDLPCPAMALPLRPR